MSFSTFGCWNFPPGSTFLPRADADADADMDQQHQDGGQQIFVCIHSFFLLFLGLGGAQVFCKVGSVSKGPGFKSCSLQSFFDGKRQFKNLVSNHSGKNWRKKT